MATRSSAGRIATLRAALTVVVLAAALGGCVDAMPEAQVARGDIRNAIARGTLTSPRAATVALVSLEGAPPSVADRFRQVFSSEAASREIAVTDEASAHYLVRGYLSAYPADDGVTVAYTYDVFDAAAKRRQERVADSIMVPGGATDPWAAVSEPVLTGLVGRAADELAVALGGTPEAQSAAGKVAAAPSAGTPPVN